MPFALFDAPATEASHHVGFAGNRLDRQSEQRSDDCVERALAEPAARLLVLQPGRIVLKVDQGQALSHFTPLEARDLGCDLDAAILLGFSDGAPRLVALTAREPDALPPGLKSLDHRSVYVQGLLDPAGLGELAQAASLTTWQTSHRFCSACGHESRMRAGGYKRACPACGKEHFPRTDPVAIMLAVSGDRCLLGRGRHFEAKRYSALAGFIEPGETIENAVRRETLEESGIRLGRVVYFASQPWPFPSSLMIGCFGEALNEDIDPELTELEHSRWFERAEVVDILAGRHPDGLTIPPPGAIAHHLIRTWAESA